MKLLMRSKIYLILIWLFLLGCNGFAGNIEAPNPLERGLSYVAAAIVTHGILQIFFRE